MEKSIYDKINFGVDYYPEHWPEERWETDAKLMKEMGLNVVRMAEFSWHKMEPEEGRYDFDWLDRIISLLGSYGIYTVLGTPSAAPPAWMCNRYPEILPVDSEGRVHGFGGRHHDCQSNPLYREKISLIVTEMAKHFAGNPYVIGWQPDNELGNSHGDFCHCDSCRKAFQGWLRKKYKDTDSLNKAWGTPFWSQEYNSFEEVYTPHITATGQNPSQMLDWKCFHSDLIVDFFKMQADIIRKYCPDHFITHNLMGFSDIVSYYDLGEQLDFASHDQYPSGYWFKDGYCSPADLGAQLDVVRSFKKKPFWIMEQESGITGWGYMGRLPEPGQLALWSLQSVAHGADAVVFFRWRACTFGTEQYWHAVLPHSGVPGKSYGELSEMIKGVAPVMDEIKGSMPVNEAAIVYSYRQNYAFQIQPHHKNLNYIAQLNRYYAALFENKVSTDFVKDTDDLSSYRLVIAPLQYLMNPELEERYRNYVKNGGNLVLTMRTGVKDDNNICMTESALPGAIKDVTGCSIYDYDCLINGPVPVAVKGNENRMPKNATIWADLVIPDEDTEVVADYAGEFYKGTACITKHAYGKGTCWYVGTEPDDALMSHLISLVIENSGIKAPGNADPEIEITSRIKNGTVYTFVLNHSDMEETYSGVEGTLIYGETAGKLKPYEVQILKK